MKKEKKVIGLLVVQNTNKKHKNIFGNKSCNNKIKYNLCHGPLSQQ